MKKRNLVAVALCMVASASCSERPSDGVSSEQALSTDLTKVTLLPACVTKVEANAWRAVFGYESWAPRPVQASIGSTNTFSPTPADRGQPVIFSPGLHAQAFSVALNGTASLSWKLGTQTVTASSTSPACPVTLNGTAPDLATFALYAQTHIRLDDARVWGGDVGVAATSPANTDQNDICRGRVDLTRGFYGYQADVHDLAIVGPVFTNKLIKNAATVGTVGPFPAKMPAIRPLATIVPGTTAINVASGATQTLAAGSYGAVTVAGKLILSGGTYQIASLTVQANATVESADGVRLRIKGALTLKDKAKLRSNPSGLARDLLVEVGASGAGAVQADSGNEIHALITAPKGNLVFGYTVNARGSFIANDIYVMNSAVVTWESGFPLPLKKCAASFQMDTKPPTVPGQDPDDLAHVIAATSCLAPDASSCEVSFLAVANFDRRSAAKQMVASLMTPAKYLAISADRSRKLLKARKDPSWVVAFCRGDADGDLVPDDRDACPGTPPMTPTDDRGCTDPTLPKAPDPDRMKTIFDHAGIMLGADCDGAPEPAAPMVTDVCLDRPNLRYLITVTKDPRQPTACLGFYQLNTFQVEKSEAREHFPALLAFEKGQAVSSTATTVTLPLPLTCDTSVETQGDGRSWPCDEANGDLFHSTLTARSINGYGLTSPWGQTRQFLAHLCK